MKIGNTELGYQPVILAPLEDITDSAFRAVCRGFGADLVYTEFVSSEALVRQAVKSNNKMGFEKSERPIGIQIFGNNTEAMKQAAQLAELQNPDLIDINFGCPVRKVAMKGAGAALLKDIPLMLEITRAVVKAVKVPVTVKTRLGWDDQSKVIVDIAEMLQDTGIQALTIHGRTRAQLYSGQADWTLIGAIKNNPRIIIPVIGNGDITSPEIAADMFSRFGVDGIMIGRAAIGNPWIFRSVKTYLSSGKLTESPTLAQRIDTCIEHLDKAIEKKGERQALLEMRKHYAGYFKGVPDFKQTRVSLLTCTEHNVVKEKLLAFK
jgi:nifR3 family TIM-barrel protein